MFNKKFIASMIGLAAAVSACKKSGDSEIFLPVTPQGSPPSATGGWPAYADQELSGKIFGKDWKAVSAVARVNPSNANETIVEIYAEKSGEACQQAFSNLPYVSVVIPTQYQKAEYVADMSGSTPQGNPLVFTSLGEESKNVMAEKTKLQIVDIQGDHFALNLYATGKEANGTISEINGKIQVIDCARAVSFTEWEQMAGTYVLKSFDGVAQHDQITRIEMEEDNFYSRADKKYLSAMVFPLFLSVSASSEMTAYFGPIRGFGLTTKQIDSTGTTLKYEYSGPMTYKGIDCTLNLQISVKKTGELYEISYTLEVPTYIDKASHSFVLKK